MFIDGAFWPRVPICLLARNGSGTGEGGAGDGGEGTGGEGGESGSGDPPARTFTQTEVDDLINRRLERDRRVREDDAERVRNEAVAQALKDNQKFEELANTRETQLQTANASVAELTGQVTSLTEQLEAANQALTKILEAQRADLPPHLTKLLDHMSPPAQLAYLAEHAQAIRQGQTEAVPNHGSSGAGNSGNGATGLTGIANDYISRQYRQGKPEDK